MNSNTKTNSKKRKQSSEKDSGKRNKVRSSESHQSPSAQNRTFSPGRLKIENVFDAQNKLKRLNLAYLKKTVIAQVIKLDKPHSIWAYEIDLESAKRIKQSWEWESAEELIASASATTSTLSVLGCDLRSWEISFETSPHLNKIPEAERSSFELDEDGSYLYWECADLHIDLEGIRAIADPEFRNKLLLEKQRYGKNFGLAISEVRKAHDLKQTDIEGLTDRHVRRIEKEGQIPGVNSLNRLAEAHGLDLNGYLKEVNQKVRMLSENSVTNSQS